MISGLISSESFTSQTVTNYRRKVMHQYPNGKATLTGLTSLMPEEETTTTKFIWFEERLPLYQDELENISTTVVFCDTTTPFAAKGTNFSQANNAAIGINVADRRRFRVNNVIEFQVKSTAPATYTVQATITSIQAGSGNDGKLIATIHNLASTITVDYDDSTRDGEAVRVIGSGSAEGETDISSSIYEEPTELYNYSQIFRLPFEMTRDAMKNPLVYEKSGPYKRDAKNAFIRHVTEIEKALIWGERGKTTVTLASGATSYRRLTGGIIWHLKQWEAQYSLYRGGDGSSTGPAAVTADTSDEKRIIENTSGLMSEKTYDKYMERLFRYTNNSSNEKLCFCGNGFLSVVNQLFKSKSVLNTDIPSKEAYGMKVVRHVTPFGDILYKTHPLFNQHPSWRNAALFMDVPNFKYNYMKDSDTQLLKMRQANDADLRKDEWFTECGLEVWFPENHMLIKNVTDYGA